MNEEQGGSGNHVCHDTCSGIPREWADTDRSELTARDQVKRKIVVQLPL
jgi:hypothetical protein